MLVRFRYTLDEWIELRRQAGCRPIFARLIYVAEEANLPLAFGLGLSALFIPIKYLGLEVPILGTLPAGFVFLPLIAFAVSQIYLTAFGGLRKRVITRSWQEHGSRLRYSINFCEAGVVVESEIPESMISWNVYKVFQTRRFYMMRRQDDSLYIPKRVLERDNDTEEFLDLLYRKTVLEAQATAT